MHKVYSFFLYVLLTAHTALSQNAFSEYEQMQDVASMVMDNTMFRLLSQIDFNSADPETKAYLELIESIETIKVFSSEKDAIRQRMHTDIKAYLQNTALESLITTNEDEQRIALYAKPSTTDNHVSELLIFLENTANTKSQNTMLVSITGDIDLKQVFKLAKDLDIPGNNALKKLGN